MRILVLQPYGDREGHFGLYTCRISQELAKLGHEVTVVTSRLRPDEFLQESPLFSVKQVGGSLTLTGGREPSSPSLIGGSLRALRSLVHTYLSGHFDVVHLFDYEPISTALLLLAYAIVGRVRLAPMFLVIHPADFQLRSNRGLRAVYKLACRPVMRWLVQRYACGATVHGIWHQQELARQLSIASPERRLFVVPYGTDTPRMPAARESARARIGVSPHETVFLFFGMLRRDKGIQYLIRAMPMVSAACRLLIVGKPFHWTEDQILAILRETRTEERVITQLEYVSEDAVADYFAAADAVVLPYVRSYTGGSGPLMLACAFGRPVIAAEVAEMAGLVKEHNIGFLCAPEDPDSLALSMERFMALPEHEVQTISENAKRLAASSSWKNMATRFVEIYETAR